MDNIFTQWTGLNIDWRCVKRHLSVTYLIRDLILWKMLEFHLIANRCCSIFYG